MKAAPKRTQIRALIRKAIDKSGHKIGRFKLTRMGARLILWYDTPDRSTHAVTMEVAK